MISFPAIDKIFNGNYFGCMASRIQIKIKPIQFIYIRYSFFPVFCRDNKKNPTFSDSYPDLFLTYSHFYENRLGRE